MRQSQRELNLKVIEALRNIGIVLDRTYEEGEAHLPYERYVYRDILFYVGALPEIHNALEEKEDIPNPRMDIVSKIFSSFYGSEDPELKKVSYNTFFDLGNKGLIPSFPVPPIHQDEDDGFSRNRTERIFTERLEIRPMDEESLAALDECDGYKERFIPYGENINFVIYLDKEIIGGINLSPLSLVDEIIYSPFVYIKKGYRGHEYGRESLDALMRMIEEKKVIMYGYRGYFLRFEEYPLSPNIMRAYVEPGDIAAMKMMEGSSFIEEGEIMVREAAGYKKLASYFHLF